MPGRWRNDVTPYLVEIMDAIGHRACRETVIMKGSQVGGTEIELNTIGYYTDHDPCAMLVVLPTLDLARAWSTDRLAPMYRDSPTLAAKMPKATARDSSTTLFHREFPGGHVTLAGANSPASLSSRPVRIVLLDETSRYPSSAGAEGNPKKLAEKRTENYWDAKLVQVSSPTDQYCQVAVDFQNSTRERYHVPCPHCGHMQVLQWRRVIWPKDAPARARYHCEARTCEKPWSDTQRRAAINWGEWRAENPGHPRRGFHIPGLMSKFRSVARLAEEFVEAQLNGPDDLKTFVNLELGEIWSEEQEGDALTPEYLHRVRRERYGDYVPAEALLLTMGVDTHPDRLECEVVAWSPDGESWSLDYQVFEGNTDELSDPGTWKRLDTYRAQTWPHENGRHMKIAGVCIDSGGHNTQIVYRYCKAREGDRVYAVRGRGGAGLPMIYSRTRKTNRYRALVYTLGSDELKSRTRRRLANDDPGTPGYCHFPLERELTYFEQLLAEHAIVQWRRGLRRVVWENPKRMRNEAFDVRCYASAVVEILDPDWQRLEAAYNATRDESERKLRRAPRRNWVKHWR